MINWEGSGETCASAYTLLETNFSVALVDMLIKRNKFSSLITHTHTFLDGMAVYCCYIYNIVACLGVRGDSSVQFYGIYLVVNYSESHNT